MRRAWLVVPLVFSLFAVFLPALASGARFDSVSVFTDNRCSNCFAPGYLLLHFVDIQDPLGLDDITRVVATPFSGNVPGPITLSFDPPASPGNIFSFDTFPTGNTPVVDPKNPPTGIYTITVNTKASGSLSILTHNLDNPQQIPFATNFAISDHSATPTVTFTQPAVPIPPGYQIRDQLRITDLSGNPDLYRTPRTLFPTGNVSFPVPSGVLSVDQTYRFQGRVFQVDLRDPGTSTVDNLENRSLTEIRVTPLPPSPIAPGSLPGSAASSFARIDIPGASNTFAVGINNSGQITGARGNGDGFLLSGGTFSKLDVPGAVRTNPQTINNSGLIVGQYLDAVSKVHGFSADPPFAPANFTTIDVPFPGARGTSANGINAAGKIVGGYTDASGVGHGFLDSKGIFTTIDPPGAKRSFAGGINNFDQIVGSYRDATGIVHGFLNSGNTLSTIDVPGAFGTAAFNINNVGQIMGIYLDADAQVHGFLKSGGTFRTVDPLSLPGATLGNTFIFSGALIPTGAFGINDAAQIVGAFPDASGNNHGYLSTPTTVPAIQQTATPAGTCGGVPCNPWASAFHPTFTSVNGVNVLDIGVNVLLNSGSPIDPAFKLAWQKGVQNVWGGTITQPRIFVSDPSGKQYALAFDLNFVTDPSQADFQVSVKPGIDRNTMLHWFTGGFDTITGTFKGPGRYPQPQDCAADPAGLCGYQGFLIAHEYGHMLGLFDEYAGGAVDPITTLALCTQEPRGTAPVHGIMANLAKNAIPYTCSAYYGKVLANFLGEGFALTVNGNAPPFPEPPPTDLVLGPESEGPPDALAPVPEPSTVMLTAVGLVIAAACCRRRKAVVSSAAA